MRRGEGPDRFLVLFMMIIRSLAPRLSCMEDVTTIMEARWKEGENLQK